MAIVDSEMAASAAKTAPYMAGRGGRPGGLQTLRILEAANLATYGVSGTALTQSLARAGVSPDLMPGMVSTLKKNILRNPKIPGTPNPQESFKRCAHDIADVTHIQGVAVDRAAGKLVFGDPGGPPVERQLRRSGVPQADVDKTISDIRNAIKKAGKKNKQKAFLDSVDLINEAATRPFRPGVLSPRGVDATGTDDATGADGAIDAMGATYMLWLGLSHAMWDSIAEMEDERHSKIREEILALGPPPALKSWRSFTYPYQRTGNPDFGNENGTDVASSVLSTSFSFPTSTSLSNSTAPPTTTSETTTTLELTETVEVTMTTETTTTVEVTTTLEPNTALEVTETVEVTETTTTTTETTTTTTTTSEPAPTSTAMPPLEEKYK